MEAHRGPYVEDDEAADELLDAYEVQEKVKANVRKYYRSYTESKKRVRIKRSRQPYMPVLAIPPDAAGMTAGAGAAAGQVQPTFRYDRKGHGKESGRKNATRNSRKEEVHMMSSEVLTEFSYMVHAEETSPATAASKLEVYLPCSH